MSLFGGSGIWSILLTGLVCLLTSCMSAPREREAQCLAATMMDVWQVEHELTVVEQAWRTAQQARPEEAVVRQRASSLSIRVADHDMSSTVEQATVRMDGLRHFSTKKGEDDPVLYRRLVDARARHREASKWYGLVALRVQTRMEEDDMLYPVLGMLATSTAIVLYPIVRWNVRSVLWDGIDPDAEDDPLQRFCIARLGEATPHPQP